MKKNHDSVYDLKVCPVGKYEEKRGQQVTPTSNSTPPLHSKTPSEYKPHMRKPLIRSNTNRVVRLQKMARGLKFHEEEFDYLCSENKGADQRLQKMVRGLKFQEEGFDYLHVCSENKGADQLCCAFIFAYAKSRFSHDAAHIIVPKYLYVVSLPSHSKMIVSLYFIYNDKFVKKTLLT